MWLEPNWTYPYWTTNSAFTTIVPGSAPFDLDGDGLTVDLAAFWHESPQS